MSTKFVCSDISGENVKLSNAQTVATWAPVCYEGLAISEAELRPGDIVEVKVEGSGRCDVGLMMGSKDSWKFRHLSEIRVNRTKSVIEIHHDKDGNEISLIYGQKTFPITMEKKTKIWIATCIKHGEILTELTSKGSLLKFCSKNKGMNISLENDKTRCLPKCKSPSSICFISGQIGQGTELLFHCTAVTEGDRKPCQRDLKIFVSKQDPACFESFVQKSSDKNSPLIHVKTMRKEKCDGLLAICVPSHDIIELITPKGKHRLSLDVTEGIWLAFDLYGVKVHAVKKTNKTDDNMNIISEDQIDSIYDNRRKRANGLSEKPRDNEIGNVDLYQRLLESHLEKQFETHCLASQTGLDKGEFAPRPVTETPGKKNKKEKINIQTHYTFLVDEIDSHFCEQLFTHEIISFGQMDAIQSLQSKGLAAANREMLKMMYRKRIAKSTLEDIVQKVGQPHLMQYFFPEEERKKKKHHKHQSK